mgnify:FL=1
MGNRNSFDDLINPPYPRKSCCKIFSNELQDLVFIDKGKNSFYQKLKRYLEII